jgi:hypothetical protein
LTDSSEPLTSPGEDDVDDVLGRQRTAGRDRATIAIGPLQRRGEIPTSSAISRSRASVSFSPECTPPPGQPDVASALVVPAEQDALAPGQERRDANPRLDHCVRAPTPEEPKPPVPRALAASSSSSTTRTLGLSTTTSCATRAPGSTVNGSRPCRLLSSLQLIGRCKAQLLPVGEIELDDAAVGDRERDDGRRAAAVGDYEARRAVHDRRPAIGQEAGTAGQYLFGNLGRATNPDDQRRAIALMVSLFERGLGKGEAIARASRAPEDAAFPQERRCRSRLVDAGSGVCGPLRIGGVRAAWDCRPLISACREAKCRVTRPTGRRAAGAASLDIPVLAEVAAESVAVEAEE